MADYDDFNGREGLSRSRWVEAWLEYGGWVVIGITLVWGVTALVQVTQAEDTFARAVWASPSADSWRFSVPASSRRRHTASSLPVARVPPRLTTFWAGPTSWTSCSC